MKKRNSATLVSHVRDSSVEIMTDNLTTTYNVYGTLALVRDAHSKVLLCLLTFESEIPDS